jgi:hypothetical protein
MKTVYWSQWGNPIESTDMYLAYNDPVNLLHDLTLQSDKENKIDNFLLCPAFVNSVKNTFMFTSPTNADVTLSPPYIKNNLPPNVPFADSNFIYKAPSIAGAETVRFKANWIFFCEDDLDMETMHPYMHKTPVTDAGYYVPGRFNISKWFRPVEYAFQMHKGVQDFKVSQEDPLIYVKFNTQDNVKLVRFNLSDDLYKLSESCIKFKQYWRQRNLTKLYEIFTRQKMKKRVIEEIKKNII